MTDLRQYGYIEKDEPSEGLIPGRVTEIQREQYTVITEYGEVSAALKGSFCHSTKTREDFPCVGDFVLLQYSNDGPSRIAGLLPRHSKFSRADFSGHAAGYVKTVLEQVIAANFDFVFILTSLNRDFNINRITRYITQSRQSGGQPVVILTKADLTDDLTSPLSSVVKALPDVPVHVISSHTGLGLEALNSYLLPGVTVVFLGMSGVGKSSLLNALMKREVMTVRTIREDDSRGRHTTTHRQLFTLPSGAMVIDTPGMRELGLFDAEEAIRSSFSDVTEWIAGCRFSDCLHKTEPGCAVLTALEAGWLSYERWESYLAHTQENKFTDDKTGYIRDKKARNKEISVKNRHKKKNERLKEL